MRLNLRRKLTMLKLSSMAVIIDADDMPQAPSVDVELDSPGMVTVPLTVTSPIASLVSVEGGLSAVKLNSPVIVPSASWVNEIVPELELQNGPESEASSHS